MLQQNPKPQSLSPNPNNCYVSFVVGAPQQLRRDGDDLTHVEVGELEGQTCCSGFGFRAYGLEFKVYVGGL